MNSFWKKIQQIDVKRFFVFGLCILLFQNVILSQSNSTFKIEKGKIEFESFKALETIKGEGNTLSGEINAKSQNLKVVADLRDLKVPNSLMNQHMHEDYLETEKFSFASFEAKQIVWDKQTNLVKAIGNFTLHGVSKPDVELNGTLEKKDGDRFEFTSEFVVKLQDHNIKIPKVLFVKVVEEFQIRVKLFLKEAE